MKKGANTDRSELKMGNYKFLTGAEKLLALDRNPSAQFNVTREESLPLEMVFSGYSFNSADKH